MAILYFFESIRTPLLDALASFVTHFGEETIILAICALVLWCIDKYEGYFLGAMGYFGLLVNQVVKITVRVERPWIKDPNFTIVESAREQAYGYSFPSGHTSNSVGIYGAIASWNKNKVVQVLCILLCIFVPMSRLYLGVHTLQDVLFSLVVALVMIFGFRPIFKKAKEDTKYLYIIFGCLFACSVIGMIYVFGYSFPENTDATNLFASQANVSSIVGVSLGMLLSIYVDSKWIHYDTKAPLLGQILKFVLGMILLIGVQQISKAIFVAILGRTALCYILRYFTLIVFMYCLWPMTFRFFTKLGKK